MDTMMKMKDILARDIKEDSSADLIRKWYKQPSIDNQFTLIAVLPDGENFIAIDEDHKWSPYSERSKYRKLDFHKGETFPRVITVVDIDGTELSEDEIITYLVKKAEEQKEAVGVDPAMAEDENYVSLSEAISSKAPLLIEKWIDEEPEKPYINLNRVNLDRLYMAYGFKTASRDGDAEVIL